MKGKVVKHRADNATEYLTYLYAPRHKGHYPEDYITYDWADRAVHKPIKVTTVKPDDAIRVLESTTTGIHSWAKGGYIRNPRPLPLNDDCIAVTFKPKDWAEAKKISMALKNLAKDTGRVVWINSCEIKDPS